MKKLLFIACIAMTSRSFSQVYFGAKGEPLSGLLIGAGQSDLFTSKSDYAGAFNRFATAVGFTPSLYMDYIPASHPLQDVSFPLKMEGIANRFKTIKSNLPKGVRLQLGITFNGNGKLSAADVKAPIAKDITAGKFDANLLAIGEGLAGLNDTVFVRLGHEFDLKSNNQLGKDYIPAYRRAHALLSSKCSKIVFVWCSAGGSGDTQRWGDSSQLFKSYPGDEYVDWFGADVFDAKEWSSKQMDNFCRFAAARKKPVMIGETTPRNVGVLTGKTAWDKWFAPMITSLLEHRIIKAVCYINWDWKKEDAARYNPGWGNWGDARIEQNAVVATSLKSALQTLVKKQSDPIYDTTRVKIVYPVTVWVTHDSTYYRDSIRYDIKPRQ
jgi:hypothetical protein